jgi:hypothetical protein
MIANSNIKDDLDEVTLLHRPERAHILVNMPTLDKQHFWSRKVNATIVVSPEKTNLLPLFLYSKRIDAKKISASHFERNDSSLIGYDANENVSYDDMIV